jgi:hypothetical protein
MNLRQMSERRIWYPVTHFSNFSQNTKTHEGQSLHATPCNKCKNRLMIHIRALEVIAPPLPILKSPQIQPVRQYCRQNGSGSVGQITPNEAQWDNLDAINHGAVQGFGFMIGDRKVHEGPNGGGKQDVQTSGFNHFFKAGLNDESAEFFHQCGADNALDNDPGDAAQFFKRLSPKYSDFVKNNGEKSRQSPDQQAE